MKKIGIFGGTFNPPHIAHSIMADDVREQMHLDKIIFIPSGVPPLKDEEDVIDARHRFNMAILAFGDNPYFEVSNLEISGAKEKSYTIDTILKLRELYKADMPMFYLIIGIDNLIDFPRWKTPEKIFAIAEVVVINRPGFLIAETEQRYSEKVTFLSVPMLNISSSMIRDYVKRNKSIKYLVNPLVEDYIKEKNLYKS